MLHGGERPWKVTLPIVMARNLVTLLFTRFAAKITGGVMSLLYALSFDLQGGEP